MFRKSLVTVFMMMVLGVGFGGCGEPIKTPQQIEQERVRKELEAKQKAEEEAKRLEQERVRKELEAKRKAEEKQKIQKYLKVEPKEFEDIKYPEIPKKGEFEKTVDFEKRKEIFFNLVDTNLTKELFCVEKDEIKTTYNADTEVLSFGKILSFSSDKPKIQLVSDLKEIDSYEATNGFGAKVTVRNVFLQFYGLIFHTPINISENHSIKIVPEKAKILNQQKLKYRIIFSPYLYKNSFADIDSTYKGKATYNSPTTGFILTKYNFASLKAIIIYYENNGKKEVVYSYLPEFDEKD